MPRHEMDGAAQDPLLGASAPQTQVGAAAWSGSKCGRARAACGQCHEHCSVEAGSRWPRYCAEFCLTFVVSAALVLLLQYFCRTTAPSRKEDQLRGVVSWTVMSALPILLRFFLIMPFMYMMRKITGYDTGQMGFLASLLCGGKQTEDNLNQLTRLELRTLLKLIEEPQPELQPPEPSQVDGGERGCFPCSYSEPERKPKLEPETETKEILIEQLRKKMKEADTADLKIEAEERAARGGWSAIVGPVALGDAGIIGIDELHNYDEVQSTWEQVRDAHELTSHQAISTSVFKLAFWHLVQPLPFLLVFWAYYKTLSYQQQLLGSIVAVREIAYTAATALAAMKCPAFLLLDPLKLWYEQQPTTAQRRERLLAYVLTPHNFVAMCLANKFRENASLFLIVAFFQVVADFASCFALFDLLSGMIVDSQAEVELNDAASDPAPMLCGYLITAVGFVCFWGPLSILRCHGDAFNQENTLVQRVISGAIGMVLLFGILYILIGFGLLGCSSTGWRTDILCWGYVPGLAVSCDGAVVEGQCAAGVCQYDYQALNERGNSESVSAVWVHDSCRPAIAPGCGYDDALFSASGNNIDVWNENWDPSDTSNHYYSHAQTLAGSGMINAVVSMDTTDTSRYVFAASSAAISVWRARSGSYSLHETLIGDGHSFKALATDSTSTMLSASADGTIKAWREGTGCEAHDGGTWCVAQNLCHDVTATKNCKATVSGASINALASTDGQGVYSGSADGQVTHWQSYYYTPTVLGRINGAVRALAVSITAQSTAVLAIGGDDGTITVVMDNAWENKRTLSGHGSGVSALVSMMQQPKQGEQALEHYVLFSSGSEDGTIKAWVADDDGTYTMEQTLTGHCNGASALKLKQCAVQALALTMDEAGGATLFSGSDDGTVKLWVV